MSRNGQSSRAVLFARSRALHSAGVVSECSSSDEDEVSIARRRSRADLLEVSLQLLDPSGIWRRTVVSFAWETSYFSKHAPSCMLFDMQRAVIRRDAS